MNGNVKTLLKSNELKLGIFVFKSNENTVNLEIYSSFTLFEHRKTQLNTVLHLIAIPLI